MSIALNNWKEFWITRIDALKLHKGVAQQELTINDNSTNNEIWKNKIRAENDWDRICNMAVGICHEIYTKAHANPSAFPTRNGNRTDWNTFYNQLQALLPQNSPTYWDTVYQVMMASQREIHEISQVFHDKLGMRFDNSDIVRDDNGNPIDARWKLFINRKINAGLTLRDMDEPQAEHDLLDLLYAHKLFKEITDEHTGLGDLIEVGATLPSGRHAVVDIFKDYNFLFKVNTTKLQQLINQDTLLQQANTKLWRAENRIRTILGITNPATPTPNDWNQQLAKKSDLDTAQATIATLNANITTLTTERDNYKTNSNEYTRIHTKLQGQVSDAELDALLNNTPPQCSHTDYDAIKTERDDLKTEQATLKTENTQLKENHQQLISELGLTENSDWQSVLTKIKELMKSPDSSDKDQQITQLTQEKSQLETQIAEKDKTISELQTQKPTEEIKSKVIESSKQLGLFSSEFQHKLDKVNSYQELVKLQEAEFSYCLNREISDKKSAGYLNIGLGVIAVGSLVILGWVLFKKSELPKIEKAGK